MEDLSKILAKCSLLKGMSVQNLCNIMELDLPDLTRHKGFIGQLVEKYLQTTAANQSMPDFVDLGIEVKTIPIDINMHPKESTYVSYINFNNIVPFKASSIRLKLLHVLWIPIIVSEHTMTFGQYILRKLPKHEEALIARDYEELTNMLILHQTPSAKHGTVLQIRPKAYSSIDRVNHNHRLKAPIGFYLRASYTKNIFKEFI